VVAVVAAPNNHVGTRIYMCGFMIGPMWLAMAVGGIVVSDALIGDQQPPVTIATWTLLPAREELLRVVASCPSLKALQPSICSN